MSSIHLPQLVEHHDHRRRVRSRPPHGPAVARRSLPSGSRLPSSELSRSKEVIWGGVPNVPGGEDRAEKIGEVELFVWFLGGEVVLKSC